MANSMITVFDLNPDAQKALEKALKGHELDYPDATGPAVNPVVIRYGDPDEAYINVQFEHGEVIVRDGADPTGTAHKFSQDQWRTYAGQPSADEAADKTAKQAAKDGRGLDGVKTGEAANRPGPSDEEQAR